MDAATALRRLRRMVAATKLPALDEGEIDDLLEMAKLTDRYNRPPTDTAWIPTWDIRRAAAEGWRWKAGKVAGGYDFQTDGQQFTRSQMYDHCLGMAAEYGRGGFTSVPMGSSCDRFPFFPFVNDELLEDLAP